MSTDLRSFARREWQLVLGAVTTLATIIGLGCWLWLLRNQTDAQLVAVWSVGSSWGLVTTLWTVGDTWRERRGLRQQHIPDPAMWLIADANMRREVLRAMGFAALLVIGLSVLLGFSSALLGRGLLIVTVALLIANSVLDRIERRQTSSVLAASALLSAGGRDVERR